MSVTIKQQGRNKTYSHLTYECRNGSICVHGWDTYPSHSVLAGQPMKCFIDSFESVEEAKAAYPMAEGSHALLQPQNSFDHLPDDGEYDDAGV